MKLPKSKLGIIFGLTYLSIFILSSVYALYLLVFHTANSEFSGLFAILVTLPWSVAFPLPVWYDSFAGKPFLYGTFAMLNLLPAALLNAGFLYLIGFLIGKITKKANNESRV